MVGRVQSVVGLKVDVGQRSMIGFNVIINLCTVSIDRMA